MWYPGSMVRARYEYTFDTHFQRSIQSEQNGDCTSLYRQRHDGSIASSALNDGCFASSPEEFQTHSYGLSSPPEVKVNPPICSYLERSLESTAAAAAPYDQWRLLGGGSFLTGEVQNYPCNWAAPNDLLGESSAQLDSLLDVTRTTSYEYLHTLVDVTTATSCEDLHTVELVGSKLSYESADHTLFLDTRLGTSYDESLLTVEDATVSSTYNSGEDSIDSILLGTEASAEIEDNLLDTLLDETIISSYHDLKHLLDTTQAASEDLDLLVDSTCPVTSTIEACRDERAPVNSRGCTKAVGNSKGNSLLADLTSFDEMIDDVFSMRELDAVRDSTQDASSPEIRETEGDAMMHYYETLDEDGSVFKRDLLLQSTGGGLQVDVTYDSVGFAPKTTPRINTYVSSTPLAMELKEPRLDTKLLGHSAQYPSHHNEVLKYSTTLSGESKWKPANGDEFEETCVSEQSQSGPSVNSPPLNFNCNVSPSSGCRVVSTNPKQGVRTNTVDLAYEKAIIVSRMLGKQTPRKPTVEYEMQRIIDQFEYESHSANNNRSKADRQRHLMKFRKEITRIMNTYCEGESRRVRYLPDFCKEELSRWVNNGNHKENPYPTKEEITAMSTELGLTKQQVEQWFENYRVRSWSPEQKGIRKGKFFRYPTERTQILKKWILENKLDPNPKGSNLVHLAKETDMTQAQIKQWCYNYRRRHKQELMQ